MKKLLALIVLVMLFVLVISTVRVNAGSNPCADSVVVHSGADCDNFWHRITYNNGCVLSWFCGTGTWPWGNLIKSFETGAISVRFLGEDTQSVGAGGVLYKSDWCDPITGKKRSGPDSSAPKPISLPKRQKYLLLDDGQMWCYTITQTPILGDAENAWCKRGDPPEGINDFCLQPNYQNLFGCTLENYNVRRVSYGRMKSYHRR